MKRVLALLLCMVMLLGLSACKKEEQTYTPPTEEVNTPTTETTEKVPVVYAHNEIINRFLVSFMDLHHGKYLDTATIRRGKDLSEYIATINECAVIITDVSKKEYPSGVRYALQFEIVGGTTEKNLDHMLEAFAAITLAMDRKCTTSSTDSASAMLKKMTQPFNTRTRVSDCVYIAYYTPVVTEPVTQPCRISLLTLDPLVTDATTTTTTK